MNLAIYRSPPNLCSTLLHQLSCLLSSTLAQSLKRIYPKAPVYCDAVPPTPSTILRPLRCDASLRFHFRSHVEVRNKKTTTHLFCSIPRSRWGGRGGLLRSCLWLPGLMTYFPTGSNMLYRSPRVLGLCVSYGCSAATRLPHIGLHAYSNASYGCLATPPVPI